MSEWARKHAPVDLFCASRVESDAPPHTHTHFAHGHHGQSVCHGDNMQYLHFETPLLPINTPWKCIYVSFIAFPVDVIEVYMLSVTAHL